MKSIALVICLCISIIVQAQEYSFIPDSLKLISMAELMKKPPPTSLDLVYYEDGTKTTLQEVLPQIFKQQLTPKMYVDTNGVYTALVVVKIELESADIKIDYKDIPDSLATLGYSFGNPESDTVIINTQGGPYSHLMTVNLKSVFTDGGIDLDKYFIINVHQAQTLPSVDIETEEISFDQAKIYADETSKILFDVVSYFKSQNKKIYIVGISFGAFTATDLIAKYGNIADGYLIMVGRLDMTEKIWKSFSQGISVSFEEDAIGVIVGEKSQVPLSVNIMKVAAGFGHNRYTDLLKEFDLSNLIYVYGKNDQNVGILTNEEIEFLNSKNAQVFGYDGPHGVWSVHFKESLNLLLN